MERVELFTMTSMPLRQVHIRLLLEGAEQQDQLQKLLEVATIPCLTPSQRWVAAEQDRTRLPEQPAVQAAEGADFQEKPVAQETSQVRRREGPAMLGARLLIMAV